MLAFQIRAFAHNDRRALKPPLSVPPNLLALVWLLLWLLLSLPYGFILLFLSLAVFDGGFWNLLLGNVSAIAALLLVLVSNILEAHRRGYVGMSDADIRLEFNWEFSMHLARAAAMILVTFILRLGLIIGLALALSYVEIYPMRTLRFFGGDSTLEADNEQRSRD